MTYYRYSVLLAACYTFLCFSPSYGQTDLSTSSASNHLTRLSKTEKLARALLKENTQTSAFASEISVFERYLQQAKGADAAQDYVSALTSFQKALSLQPDNATIKEAIKRLQNYVYDRYMLQGYEADRHRDYQTALQFFLKAKELRPDAFHPQQAVSNVTYHLAQAQQQEKTEDEQQKQRNLIFLGIGLFATILVFSIALFSLLRSSSEFESLDKESEALSFKKEPTETKKLSSSTETVASSNNLKAKENNTHTRLEQLKITESPQNLANYTNKPIAQTEIESHLQVRSNNSSLAKVDIVNELIEELNQTDLTQRRKAIWELAQRADSRAMKPLVELMIEADSQERSLILEALSQIAARTLKPLNKAIAISLEDRNSQVRKNAIRDLTRVYELMSQVTTRLAQAAGDPDEEVKETARWALGQLNQMPHISQEFLKMEHQKSLDSDDV